MQSAWLGEERQSDAVRPGVFTSMSRRVRVALGAVLSALMVAGGLGFVAAPAQANGIASGDAAADINNSFVVLLGDLDATAVTILSENGRDGFQSVDATVGGVGLDLKGSSFIEVIDATNVLLYLDTGDATGTLDEVSVTITDGTDTYTQSGSSFAATVGAQDLGDGILTVFEATAPAAGSKTITFNLRYPTDGTTTWSDDLFAAFNASTGVEVSITSGTISDGTIVGGAYWLVSGALTVDAPFGTSIRFGTVDEDSLGSSGIFAALSNAVTLTAAPTPTPDSGGGGGGSSTPATPSTDTGSGSSAGETPAPVQPVVFADPATITAAEIAALTPAQVATITPEQFGELDPAAFAGFTAAQVAAMNTGQINAIRPARAAEMTPLAVSALNADQLQVMRPRSVAALQPRALEILTAGQIGSIRPEAFKFMDGERINKIRPVQVEFMNKAQIKAINEDAISEMRLDTLREFDRDQVRAFRPDQIEAMSNRQIRVLGERFLELRDRQRQAVLNVANERGVRLPAV